MSPFDDHVSQSGDLLSQQNHLRAKLAFIENKPPWFHRRLLQETGLAPAQVADVESTSPNRPLLSTGELARLENFIRIYQAGGITETPGAVVPDDRSPFHGLDKPEFPRAPEEAPPEPPQAPDTQKPRRGRPRKTPPSPISHLQTSNSKPAMPPEPDPSAQFKELCRRYKQLDKPRGFTAAFVASAGIYHTDISRIKSGKLLANLPDSDGMFKYDRIRHTLGMAERGELISGEPSAPKSRPKPARKPKARAAPRPRSAEAPPSCTALMLPAVSTTGIIENLTAYRATLQSKLAAVDTFLASIQ
jgi:hypothetical protein